MTDRHDPNDPLAGIEPYQQLDETGGSGTQTAPPASAGGPPGMPPRSPLLSGLVLGLMLVVVSIGIFQLLRGGDDDAGPGTAADTTAAPADDGTDPTATTLPTTTLDVTGTGVPDTGDPGTQPAVPYDPVGDPLTIAEMTMATDGIGPIALGQPADQAIGALVASFGAPDDDTGPQVSVGEWGVCEGDTERIVRWGPLAAIVVVDPDGTETFAAYRLDLAYGGLSHQAVNLTTLSGLQAGTSYRQLAEQIYADFDVRQVERPEIGAVWELRSAETGNPLLWGPLADDDVVRGIYSNDACGAF